MIRAEIIKLAREAGQQHSGTSLVGIQSLERFAALISAAEREVCAKACDDTALLVVKDTEWSRGYVQGILDVADDIRARSNK